MCTRLKGETGPTWSSNSNKRPHQAELVTPTSAREAICIVGKGTGGAAHPLPSPLGATHSHIRWRVVKSHSYKVQDVAG